MNATTATRVACRDNTFCAGATIRAKAAGIPVALMAAYVHVPSKRPVK